VKTKKVSLLKLKFLDLLDTIREYLILINLGLGAVVLYNVIKLSSYYIKYIEMISGFLK